MRVRVCVCVCVCVRCDSRAEEKEREGEGGEGGEEGVIEGLSSLPGVSRSFWCKYMLIACIYIHKQYFGSFFFFFRSDSHGSAGNSMRSGLRVRGEGGRERRGGGVWHVFLGGKWWFEMP